jgi:hypothetical protein
MQNLKVYIGYDPSEDIAWEVAKFSLLRNSSIPLSVYKLKQDYLRDLGLYTRSRDESASTEFSLTRFLSPFLANHDGWTLFVDCDFLFTDDISKLLAGLDLRKSVYVVKHDYIPTKLIKMDGSKQTTYPRKNWSSFMVFNGRDQFVRSLNPTIVNNATPAYLHRFEWVPDEQIGEIDLSWNFLEGEYPRPNAIPSAIHFTNGGPWFQEWQQVDFADLWQKEKTLYEQSL